VTSFIARVRTDAGIGTGAGGHDGRDRLAQRQHPGDEQPQKHPGHDNTFYLLTISSTNQATINNLNVSLPLAGRVREGVS
jgi:hypothetical protein